MHEESSVLGTASDSLSYHRGMALLLLFFNIPQANLVIANVGQERVTNPLERLRGRLT